MNRRRLASGMTHTAFIWLYAVCAVVTLALSTGEASRLVDGFYRALPHAVWVYLLVMPIAMFATHTLTRLGWGAMDLGGRFVSRRDLRSARCWVALAAGIVMLGIGAGLLLPRFSVAGGVSDFGTTMPIVLLLVAAWVIMLGAFGVYPLRVPPLSQVLRVFRPNATPAVDALAFGAVLGVIAALATVPFVIAEGIHKPLLLGVFSGVMAVLLHDVFRPDTTPLRSMRHQVQVRIKLLLSIYTAGLMVIALEMFGLAGTLMVMACIALIALKLWLFYHHRLFGQGRVILPVIGIIVAIAVIVPKRTGVDAPIASPAALGLRQ